ncbi:hypothetical protein ISS85_03215 [Candidatus Microgenomates bacterium]|nr:hypothetical protein [Candidatus Microgenomates bacterium]
MFRLKNYWPFLLIILISFLAAKPLFQSGYFSMHDDLQLGRLFQLDKCLRDGQIPCRWVPDMGYGYGYPIFNFYSPFPYYLAEFFHLFRISFIASIKIVFILGFVLSGVFMYLLAKEFWGKIGGFVSAVFYVWLPYHAVDVYVRGALAEFWGLVWFPVVFWAVYKIVKEDKSRFIPVLAVFYSLLLLSHNLMSFFFTPAVALWGIFLVWYLRKPWKTLIKSVLGGIWGLGLAAFFILPVIFEKKFVHIKTMFIGYFNYLAHFADLSQLFFSRFWGYGPSVWGIDDRMSFTVGPFHWIIVFVSGIIFGILWLRKKDKRFLLFTFFSLLFTFCAFLTHLRSSFLWRKISVFAYMQFPWRFLGLATFFISFLGGSVLVLIKERKKALLLAFGLIAGVIFFNFSYFQPEEMIKISDKEKLFSVKGWRRLQTDAIFDYLPIYAEEPPAEPAPEQPWFEKGEGEISDFKKGTDWQEFGAVVETEVSVIRLPLYYFPNWRVWVDGKQVEISYDNFLGLITFDVSKGEHRIKARLGNTPIRSLGNFLSLFSFLGIVASVVKLNNAGRNRFNRG